MSAAIYIAVMAAVTYLIRMLPLTLFRKKIKSRFFRSLIFYIPYAVLAAMTFPAIFFSTGTILSAAIATIIALILAYIGQPLIVVSLASAFVAFLASFI